MGFRKGFGGSKFSKKSEFVRVGSMFMEKEFVPKGAKYKYTTTVTGEYFEPVADIVAKAVESGAGVKLSLIKWDDKEHPVLSIAVATPKSGKAIKKAKDDDGLMEGQQDAGL